MSTKHEEKMVMSSNDERTTNIHAQILLVYLLGHGLDETPAPTFAETRAAAAELTEATSTPNEEAITSGEVYLGFHAASVIEFAREHDNQVRQRIVRATEPELTEIHNQSSDLLGRVMEVQRTVDDEDKFRESESFALAGEAEAGAAG